MAAGPPFYGDRLARLADERLESPLAAAQTLAFHRMWIGYGELRESDVLVQKVLVTDRRPWTELFTARDTFVDPALARY